jgi:peroxiredoxin
MSNDTVAYPDDSFDNMRRFAASHGFTFPYLIDATQEVARAYDAACTPDFFGFDKDLRLQYRGRIYEMAGRQPKPGAPHELLAAMRQVARSGQGPRQQSPSIGCSIKWRAA